MDWLAIAQYVTPIIVTIAIGAAKFYSDKQRLETEKMVTIASKATRMLIGEVRTDLTKKISGLQSDMNTNKNDDKWREEWLRRHDDEIKELRKKVFNGGNK